MFSSCNGPHVSETLSRESIARELLAVTCVRSSAMNILQGKKKKRKICQFRRLTKPRCPPDCTGQKWQGGGMYFAATGVRPLTNSNQIGTFKGEGEEKEGKCTSLVLYFRPIIKHASGALFYPLPSLYSLPKNGTKREREKRGDPPIIVCLFGVLFISPLRRKR